ncbi:uncharacterized protein LOC125719322 [Brienomyrus brachyistius]|uniref:uncharacterized protein LOC125719322 n=1 Tax=Brienomyrus brachyistius TaxID=42636 RepID=UPI0020B1A213|nr:uncharacterized protein LOC125719322 [Brienomyrus brachyistius]
MKCRAPCLTGFARSLTLPRGHASNSEMARQIDVQSEIDAALAKRRDVSKSGLSIPLFWVRWQVVGDCGLGHHVLLNRCRRDRQAYLTGNERLADTLPGFKPLHAGTDPRPVWPYGPYGPHRQLSREPKRNQPPLCLSVAAPSAAATGHPSARKCEGYAEAEERVRCLTVFHAKQMAERRYFTRSLQRSTEAEHLTEEALHDETQCHTTVNMDSAL